MSLLYSQLRIFFPLVTVAKPRSSRNSSIEVSEVSKSCLLTPSSLGLRGVSELQSAPRLHAHHAQPSPGPQGTSQAPAHSVIWKKIFLFSLDSLLDWWRSTRTSMSWRELTEWSSLFSPAGTSQPSTATGRTAWGRSISTSSLTRRPSVLRTSRYYCRSARLALPPFSLIFLSSDWANLSVMCCDCHNNIKILEEREKFLHYSII